MKPPFHKNNLIFSHPLKFQPIKSSKKHYIYWTYDEIVLHNVPEEIMIEHQRIHREGVKAYAHENYNDEDFLKIVKALNQ